VRTELPTGTVTFLFTDIEGSTRLLDELGEESYAEALADHRRLLRTAFSSGRGVEVDTQGDAFLYAFGDPAEAIGAAARGQQSLDGGPVKVRMGVHTGEALLTDEGYAGRELHRAARVASSGHGGQVVVSAATRALVDAELTELGEHRLKDFDEPVALFQLGSRQFPPLKTISNTNLPRPASSFVGRHRERDELLALLRDGSRLVTLSGPGGSGKTRLAIEVAAELVPGFKAGVFWVGLAALRDPSLVMQTISQALGATRGLDDHIADRELLLLLDNFEQVVEAAPELSRVLESCPNLKVLVTSRELLRIGGEVDYAVPPLARAEAVELFCERSHLDSDETIEELCKRLDELPLALELAAARTRVLTPGQILDRLGDRLDLLTGGRDADPRQLTLRATIEWSHDLLNEDEKRLFARLAVFAGGCTFEAAEEVVGAELDVLQSLVEKSLLRRTGNRFWMLETIRELAAERFQDLPESSDIRKKHAEWCLALWSTAMEHPSVAPRESVVLLDPELENLRSAIGWAFDRDARLAFRLATSARFFLNFRGLLREGLGYATRALESPARVPPAERARLLAGAADLATRTGNYEQAEGWLIEALELYRVGGDDRKVTEMLGQLGESARCQGHHERARAAFLEALAQTEEQGERDHDTTGVVCGLGLLALQEGDLPTARTWIGRHLKLCRELPEPEGEAIALGSLGVVALLEDDLPQASVLLEQSLRLAGDLGTVEVVACTLLAYAELAAQRGEGTRATRLLAAADALYTEIGVSTEPIEQQQRVRIAAALGTEDETLAVAYEEGRALRIDEAVAYALGE
jgi:predicted ATPase